MAKQKPANDPHEMVLQMLRTKACMKQDVFQKTRETFALIKAIVEEVAGELAADMAKSDTRVMVEYRDKGELACELMVAGDIIIFHMHTNVFRLDQGHSLWNTPYMEEDEMRGYFGTINMYNFLSDSFRFHRERDLGYMVARLFLNKDSHFFVQGKRQLGFLYNDLVQNELGREKLKQVLYSVIIYVIDFDLLTPPYEHVHQVTVSEMNELNANMLLSTGKRLGFRFQADPDEIS